MTSIDYLRAYTAPRAMAVGVLFLLAVACRLPAVALAIAVQVCDRCAERLLAFGDRIPPAPVRTVSHEHRNRR